MPRLYYGYSKTSPAKGFVYALKCDNKFFVISKKVYEAVQNELQMKRPVFQTELPVYIDGINI